MFSKIYFFMVAELPNPVVDFLNFAASSNDFTISVFFIDLSNLLFRKELLRINELKRFELSSAIGGFFFDKECYYSPED